MGDLSAHFSAREFKCKGVGCCGGSSPVDSRLIDALEEVRELAGDKALTILSGFRCHTHNTTVPGSSPASQHCQGHAADVAVPPGIGVEAFADLANQVPAFHLGGIGVYVLEGFVHLDVRHQLPARWVG